METSFGHISFGKRLKGMLKVDFRKTFTSPLIYIIVGACLVMPILIFVMTTMMDGSVTVNPQTGVETVIEGFDSTWQAIASASETSGTMDMSLTGMCNINMLYFFIAVLVGLTVSQDFTSGYSKNLFAVRAKKSDYVISKTVVCFVGSSLMLTAYFLGAMLGGAISGLSFDTDSVTAANIALCMLSKLFLTLVFVGTDVLISVAAKKKAWLSIVGSLCVSMLFFTAIPLLTPLDAGISNAVICLVGGLLFAALLGFVSDKILNKTSLA